MNSEAAGVPDKTQRRPPGNVSNFELHLKSRLLSGNSGIQCRSRDMGNWSVKGYQTEICLGRDDGRWKATSLGMLAFEGGGRAGLGQVVATCGEKSIIGEGGRKQILGITGTTHESLSRAFHVSDWNDYAIIWNGGLPESSLCKSTEMEMFQ
jgi:hypothetical protein